ncbi:hypothetical protein D0C17_20415 [Vibrio cholerae]|nr:hypothetical protein [Vibrio cholerae]
MCESCISSFSRQSLHFIKLVPFRQGHNARLRGWQRINTKLKHNNRNHFGSMGLETPRVDSPS